MIEKTLLVTHEVLPSYWPRSFSSPPDTLVVHRLGPIINGKRIVSVDDALGWFKKKEAGTGCKFPYHYLIWPSISFLDISRALPLHCRGAAQKDWNARSIGIAIVGDWRISKLSTGNQKILDQFCLAVCETHGLKYLAGHSELPGGSRYTNHECPGKGIDLSSLQLATGTMSIDS